MSKNRGPHESRSLIIAYKELDTISIDEFRDALVEDTHALKDIYNIRYLRAPRKIMRLT